MSADGGRAFVRVEDRIPACPTDINDDGVTNVLDLIDLLLVFGTACPRFRHPDDALRRRVSHPGPWRRPQR